MAKKKSSVKTTKTDLDPKALRAAINAHFGPDTMSFANDDRFRVQRLSTGILSLDSILDGGVARNRHTEFYGMNNVGKTYASLCTIAAAQEQDQTCAFVNVEGSFDKEFARHIGVKTKDLDLIKHRQGNQVMDVMQTLLSSNLYDVIVCDSIAALTPKSELEADMEAGSYGTAQAKLMSGALRRLTTVNEKTAVVWINQIRENIGGSVFSPKYRTSGGMAMGFYAATRVEFVKTESVKKKRKFVDSKTSKMTEAEKPYGHRILMKVIKEKAGARTGDEATTVFNYEMARHDPIEDLLFVGANLGLIGSNGAKIPKLWVGGYEDEAVAGRNKFKKWLKDHKAIAEVLEEDIRDTFGRGLSSVDEDEGEDDG